MAQACVCSSRLEVLPDGSLCVIPGSLGLRERLVFDTCGQDQFDPSAYPWLARVDVEVVGGGGGAGGVEATGSGEANEAGGGGGGAYARRLIQVADLGGGPIIVTVGCGGDGGAAGDNDGQAGGASSFGGFLAAPGGGGGSGMPTVPAGSTGVATGGDGPAASGGDINVGGGFGGNGVVLGDGSSTETVKQNRGGSSFYANEIRTSAFTSAGAPGREHGGGASGPRNNDNQEAQPGPEGAPGVVIVHLYG